MSFWGSKHDAAKVAAQTAKKGWDYVQGGPDPMKAFRNKVADTVARDLFNTDKPTAEELKKALQFYDNMNASPQTMALLVKFQGEDGKTLPKYQGMRNALEVHFRDPQNVRDFEAALKRDPDLDDKIIRIANDPKKYNPASLIGRWDGTSQGIQNLVNQALSPPKKPVDVPKPPTETRVASAQRPARQETPRPARARATPAEAQTETPPAQARAEEVAPETSSQSPPTVTEQREAMVTLFTGDEARQAMAKNLPENIVEGVMSTIKNNTNVQDYLAKSPTAFSLITSTEDLTPDQKLQATSLMMPVLFAKGIEGKPGSEGVLRSELRETLKGMDIDPNKADAFADYILTSPKAQENLARLASENPQALQMLMGSNGQMSDAAKKLARGEIDKLMQNPQWLEDDQYMAGLSQKAGMGQMFAGLSEWMQNTLGIDIGKMFGDIGSDLSGMFNQIMSWVSGLFGNMGDGNFMRQAAGPNGSQGVGGMMERFSSANQYAMERSGVSARISGAQAIDVNGDGKIDENDRFKMVDAQGNETFGYATNLNRAMVGGQVVITDIDTKTGKATGGHTTIYGGVVKIYGPDGKELEGDVLKQRASQLGVGIQPPSQTPGMSMANAPPAGLTGA